MSVAFDSSQELNRMTKPALATLARGLQNRVQQLESGNAELTKALGESEGKLALLTGAVESLADGFVIFDSDERMVLCNRKFREIYHEIADRPGQFNALCFDVSPKCHMGGETRADGEIWDSHCRLCLNL